ncbi:MAG TPA: hypothetical protein VFY50_02800, partial [Candidatus Nitrosocosmicus sp.]|nr:hypothetical protein [Candidatus Nitrosocosmicus sp.]
LSELIPGKYFSTTARVVYLRAIEKQDALGPKMIFSGILEDSMFKVPFVSHRISYPLIRNCVYKFQSAYVHEFPEKSLLLVIYRIHQEDILKYRSLFPHVSAVIQLSDNENRLPSKGDTIKYIYTDSQHNSSL